MAVPVLVCLFLSRAYTETIYYSHARTNYPPLLELFFKKKAGHRPSYQAAEDVLIPELRLFQFTVTIYYPIPWQKLHPTHLSCAKQLSLSPLTF